MAQPQQQQAAAPKTAGKTDATGAPAARTGDLTRGLPGYDAQVSALSPKVPRPVPQVGDATTPVPPGTPAPAGAETLSPLREALLEQFRIMDGKGVGDAEFEAICGKSWWINRKQDEAAAREYNTKVYPELYKEWKRRADTDPVWAAAMKPPARQDDANFTTCIATQGKLLEAAFQLTGQKVKTVGDSKVALYTYGTMARLEAKKRDAWVPAFPGVSARPKPGDILMLEARGTPDKVQEKIDGENSPYSMASINAKDVQKQIDQARAASTGANQAMAQAAAARIPELEARLGRLKAQHDARIAELTIELDKARVGTGKVAGAEVETKDGRRGGLDFSHVGLFKDSRPELDSEGKPTGRELWNTFDGGAHVPGKIDSQGCKSSLRVYDPRTNEITGVSERGGVTTQDGKTRWLGGWTNIDALVKPPTAPGR